MLNESFWKGKRCLITGGFGFGGSHLSQALLERGANVFVLDRSAPSNSYLMLSEMANQVKYIQGDVRDLELMKVTLARFDIENVFHLAAQPVVPISLAMPYETLMINVAGTFSVLEAMRQSPHARNLVFASTGKYYGAVSQNERVPEDLPPVPADNMYASSKTAADLTVRSFAKVYGLKAAVCRFMQTYGPGNTNLSTIVPTAITRLINGEDYDFGTRDDGTSTFDPLHIRDMTRGYLAVAENLDRVSGEAFNFAGGAPVSCRELVKLISQLWDGRVREPAFRGPKKEKPVRCCLDAAKAGRVLGWYPSITLEDGLRETIKWYRQFWSRL